MKPLAALPLSIVLSALVHPGLVDRAEAGAGDLDPTFHSTGYLRAGLGPGANRANAAVI